MTDVECEKTVRGGPSRSYRSAARSRFGRDRKLLASTIGTGVIEKPQSMNSGTARYWGTHVGFRDQWPRVQTAPLRASSTAESITASLQRCPK